MIAAYSHQFLSFPNSGANNAFNSLFPFDTRPDALGVGASGVRGVPAIFVTPSSLFVLLSVVTIYYLFLYSCANTFILFADCPCALRTVNPLRDIGKNRVRQRNFHYENSHQYIRCFQLLKHAYQDAFFRFLDGVMCRNHIHCPDAKPKNPLLPVFSDNHRMLSEQFQPLHAQPQATEQNHNRFY